MLLTRLQPVQRLLQDLIAIAAQSLDVNPLAVVLTGQKRRSPVASCMNSVSLSEKTKQVRRG